MSKGNLTRERILSKAAPIFNQSGFAGTSLSDLMAASGLQKGGIYRHFKDKQELAAAAFDHAWDLASKARWSDVDTTSSSVDQLKQFMRNFVNNRSGLVQGGCPMLNTAIDADDGDAVLRDRAREALAQWMKRISDIVAAGIKKGEIQSGTDPHTMATVVISTLEGALMMSRLQQSRLPLERAREHLVGFLDGLAAVLPEAKLEQAIEQS